MGLRKWLYTPPNLNDFFFVHIREFIQLFSWKLISARRAERKHIMSESDTVYRRILIINAKTEKVIMDEMKMGPVKDEHHMREIFANTPSLKGKKGKHLVVKCYTVCSFKSLKDD